MYESLIGIPCLLKYFHRGSYRFTFYETVVSFLWTQIRGRQIDRHIGVYPVNGRKPELNRGFNPVYNFYVPILYEEWEE